MNSIVNETSTLNNETPTLNNEPPTLNNETSTLNDEPPKKRPSLGNNVPEHLINAPRILMQPIVLTGPTIRLSSKVDFSKILEHRQSFSQKLAEEETQRMSESNAEIPSVSEANLLETEITKIKNDIIDGIEQKIEETKEQLTPTNTNTISTISNIYIFFINLYNLVFCRNPL
jgi:hypothetical protein